MNGPRIIVLLLLLLLLLPGAQAVRMIGGDDPVVVSEPIDDDVFAAGGMLSIEAPVDSLIAAGGEIEVSAPVRGDVIVAGGGPAGCAAATAAARDGARTLLLESDGALGGMGTLGLVPWFCGYHDRKNVIARGLAEHVRQRLRAGMPHFDAAYAR